MKKIKLQVPLSLNDIPLYQYQDFQKILKANEGAESSTFVEMKMLEIFCGAKMEDIRNCDMSLFKVAADQMNLVLSDKEYTHRTIINIKGKEYGFIPKLEDMTMGEYVDLESTLSSPDLFHKAMAVMYRPIINKARDTYEIEPYEAKAEIENAMQYAGLSDVFASMLFFWNLGNALVKNIAHSLNPATSEVTQAPSEGVKGSVKNGAGINHSFTSLEEMLQDLTKLRDSLLNSASLN